MKGEAVILPALGAVLLQDGDEWKAWRLTGDRTLADCTRQAGLLRGRHTESIHLTDIASRDAVFERLEIESARHRALEFLLAGADRRLKEENRRGSIRRAQVALQSAAAQKFVEHRLLASPPPAEADFARAEELARDADAPACLALYQLVLRHSPCVGKVIHALRDVLTHECPLRENLPTAWAALVEAGVIAHAVRAVGDGDLSRLNLLTVEFGELPALTHLMPKLPHFLADVSRRLQTEFHLKSAAQQTEWPKPFGDSEEEDPWLMEIESWKNNEFQEKTLDPHFRWGRKGDPAAKDKVDHQVAYIETRLWRGDVAGGESAISQLIRFQRKNSDLFHVCKSLARLGAMATGFGHFDLAVRLYRVAQVADDSNEVPHNGYAETLRALGRLDEALDVYDTTRKQFPKDAVAQCGYAETLRALGRLDEALSIYDAARTEFEEDEVAHNGYAETLRDLGRLDEALTVYDSTRKKFAQGEVAHSGYAETLRALGRRNEAVRAYQATLNQFPHNRVASNALASLLICLRRYDEAEKLLRQIDSPKSQDDWRDYHVLAMSSLRRGQTQQARQRLEHGAASCPFPVSKRFFTCTLAALHLHEKQARKAAELLKLPGNVIQFPGWMVVRGHAEAEIGQTAAAEGDLNSVSQRRECQPVIHKLKQFYGLGGLPKIAPEKRSQLAEQIWDEELELLLLSAA